MKNRKGEKEGNARQQWVLLRSTKMREECGKRELHKKKKKKKKRDSWSYYLGTTTWSEIVGEEGELCGMDVSRRAGTDDSDENGDVVALCSLVLKPFFPRSHAKRRVSLFDPGFGHGRGRRMARRGGGEVGLGTSFGARAEGFRDTLR